jgi:RND superfamily putative drug exporter
MHRSISRLAGACARHPRLVLGVWALVLAAALVTMAALLSTALTTESRATTDLESRVGFDLLDNRLPGDDPLGGEVVVVRSASLTVSDPDYQRFLSSLADRLQATGEAAQLTTYASTREPALVSADRRATLLLVRLGGEHPETTVPEVIDVVEEADADPGFTAGISGPATVGSDFLTISERDLRKGELYFGLPAALIVLLLVFGALVAASVPLTLALVCIPVTLGICALIGQVFELSFFVVNMVTAMGLALGIDYSLFILSRYRAERRGGVDRLGAIARTGGTSSVAVTFSGLSFTVALLGLLLVPDTLLRSLAAGAIIVGLVTVAAALTLLPAVLALLGDRVDAGRVPFVHTAVHAGPEIEGRRWHRFIRTVVRRPAVFLALTTAVLVACALPVLELRTSSAGASALPPEVVSAKGLAMLDASFPRSGLTDPAKVVVDADPDDPAARTAVGRLQERLAGDQGFGATRLTPYPQEQLVVLDVALPGDPYGDPAKDALRTLREDHIPAAFSGVRAPVYVTGSTAFTVDSGALIDRWLPRVIGFVLALTFVLLTVVFRSVVLAAKAVALNLLSVGAAYGLLVLVFQEGVGADLLGLEQVDAVEPWVPVFLFSVLFALSMDYHVFLLSRIRERYAHTGDTAEAVVHGISSTGRIITGAALIIVVVFIGFAAGDLTDLQQMGFGVGVALLLDATLVRSLVVPTAMVLLGRWNWYLPRWLSRLPELQVESLPGRPRPPAREPAPVPGEEAKGGGRPS